MISSNVRISIAKEHHEIYEALVKRSNENPDDFPFSTMKDVFMTAVAFGKKNNKYKNIKSTKDIFSGSVLDPKNDVPVLAAVAYSHKKDFSVLFNENEILKIAEGYANGGIVILQKQVIKQSGKFRTNLLNLLLKNT